MSRFLTFSESLWINPDAIVANVDRECVLAIVQLDFYDPGPRMLKGIEYRFAADLVDLIANSRHQVALSPFYDGLELTTSRLCKLFADT